MCAALFVALYAAIQPLLAPGKVVNKAATPSTPSGDSAPAQASPSTAVSDQKEAAPQEQASVKCVLERPLVSFSWPPWQPLTFANRYRHVPCQFSLEGFPCL